MDNLINNSQILKVQLKIPNQVNKTNQANLTGIQELANIKP